MSQNLRSPGYDFKGLGFSKIGHFKQVRAKIKELENIGTELARRHNELEAIINNMTDGLTILDRDLNIVFLNKIQQALYPVGAAIGNKCFEAFYQKPHHCRGCPALKTFETEKTLTGEVVINSERQGRRYLEWSTSPIGDPFESAPRVILLMRDVTKRKEDEFNLMRADRLAAIGLLAAGIAHEINNPLASIAGFSEGLLKRVKSHLRMGEGQLIKYLQIINQEAYRCSNIIQHLIRYTQKSTDDFEVLDILPIIHDTLSLIRPHAKKNGIRITFNHGQLTGAQYLIGNEPHLKHLFLNLFNYALEAMAERGTLTVLTRTTANEVEVLIGNIEPGVLDQGITGRLRPEAAIPYHATKPGAGGIPLSLSICYTIVQHHRGQIAINHHEGNGFVFVLKFPTSSHKGL